MRRKRKSGTSFLDDSRFLSSVYGGEEEIRTPDPHVANVMLYQLSYFPKNKTPIVYQMAGQNASGGILASRFLL